MNVLHSTLTILANQRKMPFYAKDYVSIFQMVINRANKRRETLKMTFPLIIRSLCTVDVPLILCTSNPDICTILFYTIFQRRFECIRIFFWYSLLYILMWIRNILLISLPCIIKISLNMHGPITAELSSLNERQKCCPHMFS